MLVLPDFECALCAETKPALELDFVPSELGGPAAVCADCAEAFKAAVQSFLDDLTNGSHLQAG